MKQVNLKALSPLDGRYATQTSALGLYFSEYGLMKYRLLVEIEYLIALHQAKFFKVPQKEAIEALRSLYLEFNDEYAQSIKEIEKVTNHDVKAVEYFLKEELKKRNLDHAIEWVHFGLTSQDINNTAIPMYWRDAVNETYLPTLKNVIDTLNQQAQAWKTIPMLARTHGQPATPTTLGKEIKVFSYRLEQQLQSLEQIPHTGKFGGATGGLNAHYIAFPDYNWEEFSHHFLENHLKLKRQVFTTQIENYDHLIAQFQALSRINNILLDFVRDMWTYISLGYFKQLVIAGEVGSSAMPHKVNPIDFENAEGNIGIANALWNHFSDKFPVSRLQRDLSDSTVLRNLGVPLGHTLIALNSVLKGINRIEVNKDKINEDLENNWAVTAEAIQTILRRAGFEAPYEALKSLTRTSDTITSNTIREFIHQLEVSEEIKKELLAITPQNFIGNTQQF